MRYLTSLLIVALICSAVGVGQTKTPIATVHSGRYQVFFSPFARADVYLVDTESGKMWRPVTITNAEGAPEIWVPVEKLDNDVQIQTWMLQHPAAQKTANAQAATK